MERFWIKNFGCRASQADGAAIEAGLAAKGLAPASDAGEADLVVLNTCTVTATADDEVRQTVRRIHREHPQARILVTGCYAQRAPEEIARLDGVSMVVGNSHKTQIPDFVTMPYHGANSGRRYFRTAGFSFGACRRCVGRPDAAQFENSGRLQQSLLVLHYPVRARAQPQRVAGSSGRRGAAAGCKVSRSRTQRNQPGSLGTRFRRSSPAGRSAAALVE